MQESAKEEVKEEVDRTETLVIPPRVRLQTRRQSKGIVYFDRLRPKVSIEIGTLDEWYH